MTDDLTWLENSIKRLKNEHYNGKTIVMIEDNDDYVEYHKIFLDHFGYKVESSWNGKDGFDLIKKIKPDIVITDNHMPILSGVEMIDKIKSDSDLSKTKVYLLTVLEPEIHKADRVLLKPYNFDELLNSLEKDLLDD